MNDKRVFIKWANREQQLQNEKRVNEGTVITVKYYGQNNIGTLQMPTFMNIREDASWDVLKSENTPFL
jgi:hypothetical protein